MGLTRRLAFQIKFFLKMQELGKNHAKNSSVNK